MPYQLHIQTTRPNRMSSPRSRAVYALLVLAVIAAGLLWRSSLLPLPPFASKYGGDALWSLIVFFGLGLLLPRSSTLMLAVLAVGFSTAVEFSQLYHAPWIEGCVRPCPAG